MAINNLLPPDLAQSQVSNIRRQVLGGNNTSETAVVASLGYLTELQLHDARSNRQSCLETPAPSGYQIKMVAKIRDGKCTEQELVQWHANAQTRGGTHITAAIEQQMRAQFPRAANRLFGKTTSFTTQCLQGVLTALNDRVDPGKNELKNGVKPGGEMLSGRITVNEYISFRVRGGAGAYLSLEQRTQDSELVAVVGRYQVGSGRFREEQVFTMDAFSDAAAEYIRIVEAAVSATA